MRSLRERDGWFVVRDGCIRITWRNRDTGEELSQRKRRPAGLAPEHCGWVIPCADHPERNTDEL